MAIVGFENCMGVKRRFGFTVPTRLLVLVFKLTVISRSFSFYI